MKGLLAAILTAHVLFMGMLGGNLRETGKFSGLLDHYRWHRERSEQPLSFVDFLVLHYSDRAHPGSDPEHHGQLPFNGPHGAGPAVVMIASNMNAHVVGHPAPGSLQPLYAEGAEPEFLRGHIDRIFHPPKA
jgi:hypothetical protein